MYNHTMYMIKRYNCEYYRGNVIVCYGLNHNFHRHPDDIDLFSGGLSEKIPVGAATGPTFACIIATQFKNIKVADRFWYENYNTYTGFTPSKKIYV